MSKFNVLSIPLSDNDAVSAVGRLATDELFYDDYCNNVFFYGHLVDDGFMHEPLLDETKYYTQCPFCTGFIELEAKPSDGAPYRCPHCDATGSLYDYHDADSSVNDERKLLLGYLEKLDKGYVLRLFDVNLDYSDRSLDNYLNFDCNPVLMITEFGREYWYDGKVSYFENTTVADSIHAWREVKTISDADYTIVNYDDRFDEYYGSSLIADIICDVPIAKTFIETVSKRVSYRIFKTLTEYGFDQLTCDMIYVPHIFGDSTKISEVLQLDYNQVIAYAPADEISVDDVLTMRELKKHELTISRKNVEIMRVFMHKPAYEIFSYKVKKTFKYLRNQMSKTTSKNVVSDYFDYIENCRKLGLDMNSSDIRYPTNLKTAHDRVTDLVRIEANRDIDERLRDIYDLCRKYIEFADGKYCIVMPSSSEQIIREGKEQRHCVGNYCERMAKGEDIILFLRKADERDKPFYTIEIRPSLNRFGLVQCRGYRNEDESEQIRSEVDAFLAKYSEWFNRRKCDVELNTRRKYYKAVCKTPEGKYISHWDNKTEYRIGETIEASMDNNPDLTAVKGIHIASLDFAKKYGDTWNNAAILEIEVDMRDVVIPDAKDQLRAKCGKVLREVPMSELGDWGKRHGMSEATI